MALEQKQFVVITPLRFLEHVLPSGNDMFVTLLWRNLKFRLPILKGIISNFTNVHRTRDLYLLHFMPARCILSSMGLNHGLESQIVAIYSS